jgi:hypothetical protein
MQVQPDKRGPKMRIQRAAIQPPNRQVLIIVPSKHKIRNGKRSRNDVLIGRPFCYAKRQPGRDSTTPQTGGESIQHNVEQWRVHTARSRTWHTLHKPKQKHRKLTIPRKHLIPSSLTKRAFYPLRNTPTSDTVTTI